MAIYTGSLALKADLMLQYCMQDSSCAAGYLATNVLAMHDYMTMLGDVTSLHACACNRLYAWLMIMQGHS